MQVKQPQNPPSANPLSSAPLSKPRSLSIKGLILRVIEPPGTGKISVSVSLLEVIVTKPKYVLVLYPVTDLPFKRSVKPRVLTLLDEVGKTGQSNLHGGPSAALEVLDLENKIGTSIMILSTFQLIYLKIYSFTLPVFSTLYLRRYSINVK